MSALRRQYGPQSWETGGRTNQPQRGLRIDIDDAPGAAVFAYERR